MNMKILPLLIFCVASVLVAEEFKTTDGKEYKDATVTRVEPDGIVVKTKSGISKLYFTELPREVQEKFHYDPQGATAYSAAQAANYAAYQKQQEDARRQQADADAQKRAISLQQQAINNAAPQQEDEASAGRIREANQPTSSRRRKTTVLHQLPVTRSQPPPRTQPNDKKPSNKPKHQ
jgi:sRNA-binding protein